MLVFSTQLCDLLPSVTFSLVNLLPLPCVKVQYIQTVNDWEGVGVLSPAVNIILQQFNTLYLTSFRTYKNARPSQTKT
jgi:hypothetical protein